jgi:predicted small secreted protein
MKGQLSAEMLILLVLILALAAIVYTQFTKTAKNTGEDIDVKAWDIQHAGRACTTDSDCTNDNPASQLTCDSTNHCVYK